jgi:hypothetical protein
MASEYARSTMPRSSTIVPIRPQQTSETGVAPLAWSAPRAGTAVRAEELVVVRGGLGPQVNLGAIGLDLPPHGEHAYSDDDQQEQLLHWVRTPPPWLPRNRPTFVTAIHGIPEA